ncbi:hypothetical protein N9811_00850 [Bacteroidia bacterium]|nr:hypothetical protein [Bacteroidia bacterium]
MRKILVLLCIGVSWVAMAQQNDTALLRSLKVQEVKKYQYVHAFDAKQDTCLLEHIKLNTKAQETYKFTNHACMGYPHSNKVLSTYENDRLVSQSMLSNDKEVFKNRFEYGNGPTPVKQTTLLLETNDTIVTAFEHFYHKRSTREDSTITTRIGPNGTETYVTYFAYDKKKKLLAIRSVDSLGKRVDEVTNTYNAQGKLESTAHTTFGQKPTFINTFFMYDQADRVVQTSNTKNRQYVYLYKDNGLLNNVLGYNAKGDLEVETIYNYSYRK